MVSSHIISRATLDGSVYDSHNYDPTTIYNINSILVDVVRTYERAKEGYQRGSNRSTKMAIDDATNQLNMATQKKQELEKKKLVI